MLSIPSILEEKRDGRPLSQNEIQYMIMAIVSGEASRAQASAFLAFVYLRGMNDDEMVALTMSMANSGVRFKWDEGLVISDKHSTGGVGDKVSLILAPLWAELGASVPMVSGRGLGHTGGTLDKLESIQGFQTTIDYDGLQKIIKEVGCFICGQTGELAPADRILYALRNETSTVPSIPLIVGSILSKKIAAGIKNLVLDVKWGSGAFMKNKADALELANSLKRVGEGAGMRVRAELTDMNQPLGRAVGNALEVEESIQCLKGEGPPDLSKLICRLIGDPKAESLLSSGQAFSRFERMVHAQGGNLSLPFQGQGCKDLVFEAPHDGVVTQCDAYNIGMAAFVLGAGRSQASLPIHHGVGVWVDAKCKDQVVKGQPLARIKYSTKGLDACLDYLNKAFIIQPN